MFNRKFKLIGTAIGLVAVLVMGLAMPGATQQVTVPTRGQIVQGLGQLVATLTASEGDIWDVEHASFITHPNITSAYIPLHPSSRSVELLHNWVHRDEPFGDYLNFGALYVENDLPGCPGYDRLTAGIYQLKLRKDLKVVAFDAKGNEFVIGNAEKHLKKSLKIISSSRSRAPIVGGLLSALILLCAGGDVKACYKSERCVTVKAPDGSEVTECTKTEFCIEC